MRIDARRRQLRTRRRFVAGAAAASVTAAAGLAWRAVCDDGPTPDQRVDVGTSTSRSSVPLGPASWRRIDRAPLSERTGPVVVWAGDQLIVWGGGLFETSRPARDGAAWTLGGGWRPIASGPAGALPNGFAVWDGTEMFVGPIEAVSTGSSGAGDGAEAQHVIAAYDPAVDRWREVGPIAPDETRRMGPSRQAALVSSGLLVAVKAAFPGPSGHQADVVLYDTKTGDHHSLEPGPFAESPYSDASGDVHLTTVGDVVLGTPNFDLRPWMLESGGGRWVRLPGPRSESLHLLPATSIGQRAAFRESDSPQFWLLDPKTATWERAAPSPYEGARWGYDPVWSGDELFLPGLAYNPDGDSWRTVDPPPRGKNRQRDLQARWATDALLLFGGEEYTCPDPAICDRFRSDPDSLDGWILRH